MISSRALLLFVFLPACASTPRISGEGIALDRARTWLDRYCSRGPEAIEGSLSVKSDTPDFRGQFPASLRFESNGRFELEVTGLLGGTLLRLSGDHRSMDLELPSKPGRSRKGIGEYLGIGLPVLSQMLQGHLPCPKEARGSGVRVEGPVIRVDAADGEWSFFRSEAASGEVPVRVLMVPRVQSGGRIEFEVLSWDREDAYVEKALVRVQEGTLKWIWKNRGTGLR